MALRVGVLWVIPRFPIISLLPPSPGARAARKDGMNNEKKDKILTLTREVLLNAKAQLEWIFTTDSDDLDAFGAFARHFLEKDENTSKVDAFRLGILLGGVYERNKQKGKIEK
jgi:hypothetical protein